jgi:hypothetical protein
MYTIPKTALEAAILDRLHDLYDARGFPPEPSIRVLRRENTGSGRYVALESDARVQIVDGYIDLGGSFIEMNGLPNGMMAVALVKDKRLMTLEITVYGGDSWNGDEREWKIV